MAITIKVSEDLRDQINAVAKERGCTASSLIEDLLEKYLVEERVKAAAQAINSAGQDYWDEMSEWERISV